MPSDTRPYRLAIGVILGIIGGLAAFAGVRSAAGLAQPGHSHAQGEHGSDHAESPRPGSLGEAVARIRAHLEAIQPCLDRKDLHDCHDDVYGLSQTSGHLAALVLAPDAPIPAEKAREAGELARDIRTLAEAIHDAGHDRRGAVARQKASRLTETLAKLEGLMPDCWVCDMRCEPGKVYPHAAICPVCRMALTPFERAPWYTVVTPVTRPVAAGHPVELIVKPMDPAGAPAGELDGSEGRPFRVLIIPDDLAEVIEPEAQSSEDGSYRVWPTLPRAGAYTVYSLFTPSGGTPQAAASRLSAAGEGAMRAPELRDDTPIVKHAGDAEVRLRCNAGPFVAGVESFLRFGLDRDLTPVTDIEPVDGVLASVVVVKGDNSRLVPVERVDVAAAVGSAPGSAAHRAIDYGNHKATDLIFRLVFPEPGMYRAMARFRRQGETHTVAFDIEAVPGETPAGGHEHH